MHSIYYQIHNIRGNTFDEMIIDSLSDIEYDNIVRILFFTSAIDNNDFLVKKETIRRALRCKCTSAALPTWSLIIQQPLECDLVVEIHRCNEGIIQRKKGYIVIESDELKELIISNVSDCTTTSIYNQSEASFRQIEDILHREKMQFGDITRQWNYIERITAISLEHQHYQDFNDVRSHYYNKSNWPSGYPAATGIGTQWGGIIIDLNAIKPKSEEVTIVSIDNDQQVAAHSYSEDVLLGKKTKKTTPKFERAKTIISSHGGIIYISGTAAIRGEASMTGLDILAQTQMTMENIEHLITSSKLKKLGFMHRNLNFELFRVYLKQEHDLLPVRRYMQQHYPETPTCYLLADICRDELLIEIEGVAHLDV